MMMKTFSRQEYKIVCKNGKRITAFALGIKVETPQRLSLIFYGFCERPTEAQQNPIKNRFRREELKRKARSNALIIIDLRELIIRGPERDMTIFGLNFG